MGNTDKVEGPRDTQSLLEGNGQPIGIREKMRQRIKDMDKYCWERGKLGGLDWGFEQLNTAFGGLNPGLILVAAQSNVGKSGFCMQLAQQISYSNREVTEERSRRAFVIYFSLDDNFNELGPRFVAIDQKIPINVVKSPRKFEDNHQWMERRQIGMKRFEENVDYFAQFDANDGTDIEYIENQCKSIALEMAQIDPAFQLVIFIDNFHDITVRDINFGSNANAKYDYIADRLSKICTSFDCPIICTAELRKLNSNRRPTMEDIRESVKIVYEAKAIIMAYNEVGLRGQQAQIFWKRGDSNDNQPIFEAKIDKNKYSSYKGRIFYEFIPEMSYFKEVPPVGAQRYNQMISG